MKQAGVRFFIGSPLPIADTLPERRHTETIRLVVNALLTGEAPLCKVTLPLFNFVNVERIRSSSLALAVSFFSCREDSRRSSLGPGWLELPIVDCRFSIADGHWKKLPHHFFNRQSAISNRQGEQFLIGAPLEAFRNERQ